MRCGAGGHGHHPGPWPGDEGGQEQAGQGEVAEVIGAELHLEAVRGGAVRDGHHARVVDQQVEALGVAGRPRLGEAAHRAQVGQVEASHVDDGIRRRGGDVDARRRLPLVESRTASVTAASVAGQFEGRLEADPGVGAGHDRRSHGRRDRACRRRSSGGIGHVPSQRDRVDGVRAPRFLPRTGALCTLAWLYAPLAQTAERLHGKEKVYGSIP